MKNSELKGHENPSKTMPPAKHHHPLVWYVKWVSSVFIVVALLFTSNNVYPANLIFHLIGLVGWFIVGWCWHDRALMALNTVGISIMANGLIIYVVDVLRI